jgi:hypothetical protein
MRAACQEHAQFYQIEYSDVSPRRAQATLGCARSILAAAGNFCLPFNAALTMSA